MIAKLGDVAAAARLRRIHILMWRDLDDPEAGGSELHAHEIASRWAAAGLDVTIRTSFAADHPPVTRRSGYRVIRRAGRYMVFPRAALAERTGLHGPSDGLVEIWNGMPFFSPLWAKGPRIVFLHHLHAEMWDMTLPPNLARLGRILEARVAPPLYRGTTLVTLSESSKRELVDDMGFSDIGCYGSEIWEIVAQVLTISRNGALNLRRPADYDIGYRSVTLRSKAEEWFAASWLKLPRGNSIAAQEKVRELLKRRIMSQPLNEPNAGSVFRNPPGVFAAQLIEQCGLKGERVGDAVVSAKHANFIVNTGAATAADIEALIEKVRHTVRQKCGIELETEVRIIGNA